MSRSVSLVLAYLILEEKMTLERAYKYVKQRRGIAMVKKNIHIASFLFSITN